MLKITDLEFGYADSPLYEKVSFLVAKGHKVGLVGQNGSGKSTLLKIIKGEEESYKGKVEVSGEIALVPQEVKYDPILEIAKTAREYVDPEKTSQDFEILKLLKNLEFELDLKSKPSELSGGQKTKLALARALLSNPDILLLDEPTNFMDDSGKKFVMGFLAKYMGTVIVISHDLNLMDRCLDKVLFVNPATKSIEEYSGTYSDFVRLKKEREETLKKQIIVKAKHIKQMEEGLRKMTRFSSAKGVRARVRQQKRIAKEKANLPQMPTQLRQMSISLPTPANIGELVIKAEHISKSYSDLHVLKNVNFSILRGQKIVLVGSNGAGKSTFIKIIMDRLKADSGFVTKNPQVKIGYYSQEFETFDFNQTLLDAFMHQTHKDTSFARGFLGRFNFVQDKVFQRIESLSGGEKTRLSIAMLMGVDNNLLILDEPTTYLDVMSQRIILESLKQYKGTMIIVSHEAQFLQELKPDKAYLFPEEKMVFWDDELLEMVEVI